MERWKEIKRVPAPALAPAYGGLSGMRVLMTGSVVSAPFAATILAEHGAEVIHVERPGYGDPFRGQAPVITNGNGGEKPFRLAGPEVPALEKVSTGWIQDARNKLSLTLEVNLKIPEAKDIFLSLIKNSDVWLENMVWTEKLGITEEMLFEVNPKLVIAHISGFGRPQFGGAPEECDRPSYDAIGQAEGGWMHLNGFPDMPPSLGGAFVNDYVTAMFAVSGILVAYINAQMTGQGQAVDVSQAECMSKCLNDTFVNYLTLGLVKTRGGNKIPIFQPAGLFKTKDGYLFIGSYGPAVYGRALKAMGIDVEKYPHEKAGASREAVASELGRELDSLVEQWMAARTSDEAAAELKKFKVPCGVPRTAEELVNNEHYKKRGNWIQYEDQTLGKTITAYGFAPKMSRTKQQVWRGAPRLGQDTDAILSKIIGYSDSEIAGLKGRGIID
jgi:crotonobetainyl-CoA:carnitine CoA-transferase CaiB-like acyl-CoA transferase